MLTFGMLFFLNITVKNHLIFKYSSFQLYAFVLHQPWFTLTDRQNLIRIQITPFIAVCEVFKPENAF